MVNVPFSPRKKHLQQNCTQPASVLSNWTGAVSSVVVCRRGVTLQVRAGICLRSLLPIADTALVLEESRVLLLGSFLGLSVLFQSMGRKRGRKWGGAE